MPPNGAPYPPNAYPHPYPPYNPNAPSSRGYNNNRGYPNGHHRTPGSSQSGSKYNHRTPSHHPPKPEEEV